MAIEVAFYTLVGLMVAFGVDGTPLMAAVFLAGLGQGIAFPRLFATVLGDVPAAEGGVAAGITNSALQIGAAVSVAAVGSLFFIVLDGGTGERAYAHAFSIAQWTATVGLFFAMLLALPPRRRLPTLTN
jgi:sugar phosphate permease